MDDCSFCGTEGGLLDGEVCDLVELQRLLSLGLAKKKHKRGP